MAKIKRTNMPISGKLGDYVYTNGIDGQTVRMVQKFGSKEKVRGLKPQYTRTALINGLASQINNVAQIYNKRFTGTGFYRPMMTILRKEPENNRFLRLLQLKGMEVNDRYQLQKLAHIDCEVKQGKDKISVIISTKCHPQPETPGADCYDFELLLVGWDKTNNTPTVERQLSHWMWMKDPVNEMTFSFKKRKGMTQWLLFLRIRLGVKEQYLEKFVAEGMRIMEIGSFDPADLVLLKEKHAERLNTASTRTREIRPQEVRVGVVRVKGV